MELAPMMGADDRSGEDSDAAWAEAVHREAILRPLAARDRVTAAELAGAARDLGLGRSQTAALLRALRARPLTSTLVPNRPGPKRGSVKLPATLEMVIAEAIETTFLTPERPSVTALAREVALLCRGRGLPPPSRKAVAARLAHLPARATLRQREGQSAARRLAPVVGSLATERPREVWQIDHTLADVMLVDDAGRRPIGRPWLTLVLDVHTRVVPGFHVSLAPPSAGGVALAVAQAVLSKEGWLAARGLDLPWPVSGLPEALHMDNAREFRSAALRRGLEEHGIRPEFRPVATPHWGGHIERLMGTLMERLHAAPGTTFSSVAERGDYDAEGRAVLTLAEFERRLALEVLGPYHHEVHAALHRPPLDAWRAWAGPPRMPADDDGFVLDFLPAESRCVRRDGVRLFNIRYQDGGLAHLVGADLRLLVKYDPRDLSAVFVQLPDGDHVRVPYADLRRPPITLWEHRAAERALREAGHRAVDEGLIFAALEEIRRTDREATAATRAARRAAQRDTTEGAAARALGWFGSAQRGRGGDAATPGEEADAEARVPVLTEEDIAAVEFWS